MKFKLTDKAQALYDIGGSENVEGHKELEEFAGHISCGDGFWYGLNDGGYIDPADVIGDKKQLAELNAAIELVIQFENLWTMLSYEF